MRYVLMFVGDSSQGEPEGAVMEQVGQWWEAHSRSGEIVGGERLHPASRSTTVRHEGATPTVLDGPFAETKEEIGGFAVIEVPDLDAALGLAKTWPGSPAVEIRPVWEM